MTRIILSIGIAAAMSGSAFAGGNCIYGQKQAQLAKADTAVERIGAEQTDPRILARIKKEDEKDSLVLEQPIIHN